MKDNKKEINFSKIPVSSSLGHLAYGDLAFTAWRKIKLEKNLKREDEEE